VKISVIDFAVLIESTNSLVEPAWNYFDLPNNTSKFYCSNSRNYLPTEIGYKGRKGNTIERWIIVTASSSNH